MTFPNALRFLQWSFLSWGGGKSKAYIFCFILIWITQTIFGAKVGIYSLGRGVKKYHRGEEKKTKMSDCITLNFEAIQIFS